MQHVNVQLGQLPRPEERERYKRQALETGNQLASLFACWDTAQQAGDHPLLGRYVNSLLRAGGLVWDSEKRAILAIRPHPQYVPVLLLAMGIEWHQDGEYLRCIRPYGLREVEWKTSLTREQASEVAALHKQGLSIREIAQKVGVGRMVVHRYLKSI